MINVGIIVCGFVGGALKHNNPECKPALTPVANTASRWVPTGKVHTGILLSGYINDTHTYVPGPDGKFGYGGKCFPKDVNAFAKMTEGTPLGTLLEHLHELNVHFRGVEEHI